MEAITQIFLVMMVWAVAAAWIFALVNMAITGDVHPGEALAGSLIALLLAFASARQAFPHAVWVSLLRCVAGSLLIGQFLAPQRIAKFWWIGPFTNEDNVGRGRVFKPEEEYLRNGFDKDAQYDGKNGRVKWTAPDQPTVDGNMPNITMYAFVRLDWPKAEEASFRVFADDGIVLWVNRKEVFRRNEYGESDVPVALQQGTNELFLKVVNDGGPWGLWVDTMKVSPIRCRYKSLATLLVEGKPEENERQRVLSELVRTAADLGDREAFKHWAIAGARVLSGKKRDEFLRDALRRIEEKNYGDLVPTLAKEMTAQDMEEDTWLLWARAMQLAGNFDKAMDIYRQVLDKAEFSVKGRFAAGLELARLLASLGDQRGATETIQKLLEQFPDKKEDKEFAKTRGTIESLREANIVMDLDDEYERAAERVDRLLQSQKEREAFRGLQRSLLSIGGRAVRTDDPQLHVGAARRFRELVEKHRTAYVAFLQAEQDELWKRWQRLRHPALATEALRQEMDAAAEVKRWMELAAWEFERGNVERAQAFHERARNAAPGLAETPSAKDLALALGRACAGARAPEPLKVKDLRSWTFEFAPSFFLTQTRDRQDLDAPEALYRCTERDGVFYFANEECLWAVTEGKPLWKYESGGLACSEVMNENDVLLAAPAAPIIEDTRVYARMLVPESGGTDARFAIVCLDRLSGREVWRTNGEAFARTHVTSPPCVEGGRVLVTALTRAAQGGDRSELYLFILDSESGAPLERMFLCANPDSLDGIRTATSIGAPARDARHLYYDTGMGVLVCMDRATLQLRWLRNYPRLRPGDGLFRSRLLNRVNSSPAADQGIVTFAPADSAFVFFLEAETGREVARMSSLVFRSLLGARGETAYFLGDAVTAVDVKTGKSRWQLTAEPDKLVSAWLGQKEALVQCGLRTRCLDLEKGQWTGDADLPAGLTLLDASARHVAALRSGQYVLFDRRPERELPSSWRLAGAGDFRPTLLDGSALPVRQTGTIPYPGARIAGFWYGGREPGENEKPEGLFFQAQGWYGLYRQDRHQEVWRRVNSGGRIFPQGDRVVQIEGNKRKLEVVDAATGRTLFTWTPQRRVRDPQIECPLVRDDRILFYFANHDWQTKREMNLYVYNLKDQTQVKVLPYGETPPAPRIALWDDTFYALGFWHPWESDKKPLLVTRPLVDEKPQSSGFWGRSWLSAEWDARKRELLIASPEGCRIGVGKPPFGENDVRCVRVEQKHTWNEARFHYSKGCYVNEKYLVSPWFVSPRVVLDRVTLQPVKLPDAADLKDLQPMPAGRDQLLFCGSTAGNTKPKDPKLGVMREVPYRVLYLFKDGQARPIGEIKPYFHKDLVDENENRWLRDQLRFVHIKPAGNLAWVFVTAENYNEHWNHTVWQPAVGYRVNLAQETTEGPFYLPMACTADIEVCGDELAFASPGGLVFFAPEKGPLAKEETLGVTARFRTGEFFLLDGFLNEWKADEFAEIRPGLRMAASFDGEKIRLAAVLGGVAQGRFTGENLRLVASFLSNGFYRGMPLPWMRNDVRLGETTAGGDGMRYTVAANGDLRFEAEMPMRSLYHNQKNPDGNFDLVQPHSFRMRLDLLDPGVPGGVLATLGGTSPDLRPYEMFWFRFEPANLDEMMKTAFDGGQWVAGYREARWFLGAGTYFMLRPKDKKLSWTLQRSIPRNAVLDFGTLRSIHDANFKIRIFANGTQIAWKDVAKGMAPEAYKASLAEYGGQGVLLRVDFETKGDWPPVILQQIRISK